MRTTENRKIAAIMIVAMTVTLASCTVTYGHPRHHRHHPQHHKTVIVAEQSDLRDNAALTFEESLATKTEKIWQH